MTPDEQRLQSRERASRRFREIVKRVDELIAREPYAGPPRVDSHYHLRDLPKGRSCLDD